MKAVVLAFCGLALAGCGPRPMRDAEIVASREAHTAAWRARLQAESEQADAKLRAEVASDTQRMQTTNDNPASQKAINAWSRCVFDTGRDLTIATAEPVQTIVGASFAKCVHAENAAVLTWQTIGGTDIARRLHDDKLRVMSSGLMTVLVDLRAGLNRAARGTSQTAPKPPPSAPPSADKEI